MAKSYVSIVYFIILLLNWGTAAINVVVKNIVLGSFYSLWPPFLIAYL